MRAFFLTARPTDLWQARKLASPRDLEIALDGEFFDGAVEAGRRVFAANCARCHSSQASPYDNVDFRATDRKDPTLRIDWLGNELPSLASEIGTYTARAMHSNHIQSRVWEQYASLTLHERLPDPNLPEIMKGGGRGYYRNISLLSAWAHAPFMHNNAIGPEICGKPKDAAVDFYSSPYVDAKGVPLADPPPCWPFDTSAEGRYKLYKASMEDLLYPDRRLPKMPTLDRDILIDVAPKIKIGDLETGLILRVPKGYAAIALNSLRVKDLMQDLVLAERAPEKFNEKYARLLTDGQRKELRTALTSWYKLLLGDPGPKILDLVGDQNAFVQRYYSNALEPIENAGHRFGEDLSDRDKQALIAFIATL